jgi:hypothetical protein
MQVDTDKPLEFLNLKLKNPNHSNAYSLTLCSKHIFSSLYNYGLTTNKSLIITFPPSNIPNKYYSSFIRGYFDGDGCIWNGKRKEMVVKDKERKSGERIRIIQNVKFSITGNF